MQKPNRHSVELLEILQVDGLVGFVERSLVLEPGLLTISIKCLRHVTLCLSKNSVHPRIDT